MIFQESAYSRIAQFFWGEAMDIPQSDLQVVWAGGWWRVGSQGEAGANRQRPRLRIGSFLRGVKVHGV